MRKDGGGARTAIVQFKETAVGDPSQDLGNPTLLNCVLFEICYRLANCSLTTANVTCPDLKSVN